ncbi:hypothetical protein ABT121_35010 [Streptomyces sp. NPDC001928]|uniref:hypothetical protein n=1 Tax=Streptomyces sp. NPDC001928 TaxID=3154404 RepID=UPI00332CC8C6
MITLQISAVNGLIVALSLVVGVLVYRRTVSGQVKGDLALAAGAVAACVLVLGFLFGVGDGAVIPTDVPPPAVAESPTSSAPSP